MTSPLSRGGPTVKAETSMHQIRRVLNPSAGQLAEKSLAKALTGDAFALLACAELMKMANAPQQK